MLESNESFDWLQIGLQSGPMTEVTSAIRAVSLGIGGEGLQFIENACKYIHLNFATPKEKPDKMKRTADEILSGAPDPSIGNKKPIAHCTEWGKLLRTIFLAKGYPTIWVNSIPEDWIRAEGEWSNPDNYSNHVFLDIYVNGGWVTLNTTGAPDLEKGLIRRGATDNEKYYLDTNAGRTYYRPYMRGLDHMHAWTPDERLISSSDKKQWHIFINHEFPERIERLERNPVDY
ncbi:hypothetical protein JW887_00425 [Candidatus Dojkabacteria bacterium]|nr:hypothetical protein [Candidatus Dojkabacteria bacterium]